MDDPQPIVDALDAGTQPVLYSNVHNAKCRVVSYEQHDPDGEPLFSLQVEGYGEFSGFSAIDLFDDREPEISAEEPPPATDWAWTQEAQVEAITDQVKEALDK